MSFVSFKLFFSRSSVYHCENKFCINHTGRRLKSRSCMKCKVCGSSLTELFINGRESGDFVQIHLIPIKAFQNHPGIGEAKAVILRDEVLKNVKLNLGDEYVVAGAMASECSQTLLEAWHIHKKGVPPEDLKQFIHSKAPFKLTANLTDLMNYVETFCPRSPWAFVNTIVSQLGTGLFPDTSYLHLKYGLFLSLASQKRKSPPIPIVAVGADTFSSQKLIYLAGDLSERCTCSSQGSLMGEIKYVQEKIIWEEAGKILCATDGVCILGDWAGYQRHTTKADSILRCVESGSVLLTDRTGINLIAQSPVPLRTALWTYWCHITTKKRDQLQLRTLIDVFGIPFLSDETDNCEVQKISNQLLITSMSYKKSIQKYKLTTAELKYYLKIVNNTEIEMGEKASNLIRQFFVASRAENPNCLPVGAIATISSLATAHARLALRSEVQSEDVVLVIYLYQKAIWTLFGQQSIFGRYKSIPKIGDEPNFLYIHKELTNFTHWLNDYIGMFCRQ